LYGAAVVGALSGSPHTYAQEANNSKPTLEEASDEEGLRPIVKFARGATIRPRDRKTTGQDPSLEPFSTVPSYQEHTSSRERQGLPRRYIWAICFGSVLGGVAGILTYNLLTYKFRRELKEIRREIDEIKLLETFE